MKRICKNSLWNKSLFMLWWGVVSAFPSTAQNNLVQNPSFEIYTTCPNSTDQMHYSTGWGKLADGTGGSPDFMHQCTQTTQIDVPLSDLDDLPCYQAPKTGEGYGRILAFARVDFSPSYSSREYIQTQLAEKLQEGKSYCVAVHLNLCDPSYVAIDRIGVYLDDGTVTAPGDLVANGIPQIQSDSGVYLTDTISWMKLSGSFISNGAEEYLTVGNFYDNAHTNYIERPSSPQNGYLVACYLIDDISVIPSDLPAYAGRDTMVGLGDSVFIGREPEIGLECTWYDLSGQVIGQGAGMWVTPTHISTYIVEQTLCGNITRDTVTIWALGTDIDIAEKEQVRIYPNPVQNHFHVSVPFAANSVKLSVWDMVGKQLFTQTWTSPSEIDTDIPTPNWAKGLYLFKIEIDENTTQIRRLVKE